MSEPTNSAARNAMTDHERQCYDWGWEDAEERIIALIFDEEDLAVSSLIADWYYAGNDNSKDDIIALIKGEQK